MRKHPFYGTEHDNSYIGDIIRFIDEHAGLRPHEKDVLVNRLTERPTADELSMAYQPQPPTETASP